MAAPNITLSKNQVLVVASDSTLGIIPITADIMFGVVELVSDLEDKILVGDSVMFLKDKGSKFMYGSTVYYLLDNNSISSVEIIP